MIWLGGWISGDSWKAAGQCPLTPCQASDWVAGRLGGWSSPHLQRSIGRKHQVGRLEVAMDDLKRGYKEMSVGWGGDVDTFYDSLLVRITEYQQNEPDESWTGIIVKQ